MAHQMVAMANTETEDFKGYLSLPPSGKGSGIVLAQEIFGVNSVMRSIADQFAQAGYAVLVPDLYWRIEPGIQLGYEGQDLEEAFGYYKRYNLTEGIKDLGLAIETLKAHPACSGNVAVLGFCFGGKLAYLTAASHEVDAAVAFYGVGIVDYLGVAANINCPMLMHFGEKDEMIPADQVARIKAAFRGKDDVEIYVYPGAGHAFYNRIRPTYNYEAAILSYERTISFLSHALIKSEAFV